MKVGIIMMAFMCSITTSIAQAPIQEHHIRDADMMWSIRVWREIDLRQKINLPLYYPLEGHEGYVSLFDVLIKGVNDEGIRAFGTGPLGQSSELNNPLTLVEVQSILMKRDTVSTVNLENDEWIKVPTEDSISCAQITRFRIMEDWIFDRQRSMMIPRIRAIAPMKEVRGQEGEIRGYTLLFWLDFEQSRPYMSEAPVYMRQNNNHALSYDDLFMKRYFSGFIVKESNVFDRSIGDYAQGVEALLEGQAIEEKIRNFESDLWDY